MGKIYFASFRVEDKTASICLTDLASFWSFMNCLN